MAAFPSTFEELLVELGMTMGDDDVSSMVAFLARPDVDVRAPEDLEGMDLNDLDSASGHLAPRLKRKIRTLVAKANLWASTSFRSRLETSTTTKVTASLSSHEVTVPGHCAQDACAATTPVVTRRARP